jgi:hypothetical protein
MEQKTGGFLAVIAGFMSILVTYKEIAYRFM